MATDNKVTRDDSILGTIAKLIGGEVDGGHFDTDLIVAVNTALAVLTQLGVGPDKGFSIQDGEATWADFIGDDNRLSMVVTYVQLKAQLIFDPPQSGILRETKESLVKEMEWRSFIACDPISTSESDGP